MAEDETQASVPSDGEEAKDYSNEIFVRRKLAWVVGKLVYVWIVACTIWIALHQDDGHGSMLRVILWSTFLFPAFLVMAFLGVWRCPQCGTHLGRSVKTMTCKSCGLDLDTRRH